MIDIRIAHLQQWGSALPCALETDRAAVWLHAILAPLVPAARTAFRRRLLAWFDTAKRDLPWRRTRDPYRIWLSEIMLQQTRVVAAIPYYERFLARFPTVSDLAAASEEDVLTQWAGLGYYSRARNLHKAARKIIESGGVFPEQYDAIRDLTGVGDYTAAAVASIAFGLPRASVDGNVLRVLARVSNDAGDIAAKPTRERLGALATTLLDRARPGDFNQALMELGAVICVPRSPHCSECPVHDQCEARRTGRETELPIKLGRKINLEIAETLLIIEKHGSVLVWQRLPGSGRMAGFWELPEASQLPQALLGPEVGVVRHTITHQNYTFRVCRAKLRNVPQGYRWMTKPELSTVPASTVLRKVLALV